MQIWHSAVPHRRVAPRRPDFTFAISRRLIPKRDTCGRGERDKLSVSFAEYFTIASCAFFTAAIGNIFSGVIDSKRHEAP